MGLVLENNEVAVCLGELEDEFLRVGAERCEYMNLVSQLSAFLRAGVRSVSLLRAMHLLLREQLLDSYDPVRRAFWESWQLQLDFRLVDSGSKAAKWFQKENKHWKVDVKKLTEFVELLGNERPSFGKEYGDLTELTHPTYQATQNSVGVVLGRRNAPPNFAEGIAREAQKCSEDFTGMLVREIWLIYVAHEKLIETYISKEKLQFCERLLWAYEERHGN